MGFRFKDRPPLLHFGNARLLHLQGWSSAYELDHGQQAGAYEFDQRFTELDRGLRDVREAVPFYPMVIPNPFDRGAMENSIPGLFLPRGEDSLSLSGIS